jgi:hypothetical protein
MMGIMAFGMEVRKKNGILPGQTQHPVIQTGIEKEIKGPKGVSGRQNGILNLSAPVEVLSMSGTCIDTN